MTSKDADAKVRFLLGLLTLEEREAMERQALADDDAYGELVAAEDELFHDYACAALSDDEKARFEQIFLGSEEGRRRLERARRTLAAVEAADSKGASRWVWLAVAAGLLLALAALFMRKVEEPKIAVATPTPRAAAPAATPPPRQGAASTVLAVSLMPGAVRGEDGRQRLHLGSDVTLVRLSLTLPKGRRSAPYSAELRRSDDRRVWRSDDVRPSSPAATVTVDVPAGVLAEDDYELTLSAGAEPIADYVFGVVVP